MEILCVSNHTHTFNSGVRARSNSRRTLPLEGIRSRPLNELLTLNTLAKVEDNGFTTELYI